MVRKWVGSLAPMLALALLPGPVLARGLAIEVWTDRGNDAVYQPGDQMQVKIRPSADAYVLVYEIDAEGYVNVLFPYKSRGGFLEGRRTYRVPAPDDNVELVVQKSVGQGYIVALGSLDPLDGLPWYLRPYNPQAEGVGYVGRAEDEEGITAEGRIVGDPFVAMERIRRRVLKDPEDGDVFATAYTSYYVHHEVRYPRYLCYDCHRPGRWAWWDGFDPYYTNCSAFDVRVNWSWYWGPSFWYGRVPYFVYVYRSDCPPSYRPYYRQGNWYSSWDGWSRWNGLWGSATLTRYKSPPPPGYVPPSKFGPGSKWGPGQPAPPGFLSGDARRSRGGVAILPEGRNAGAREEKGDGGAREPRFTGGLRPSEPGRMPVGVAREDEGRGARGGPAVERPRREERPVPVERAPRGEPGPRVAPREERPAPRGEAPREERPRVAPPREERPAPRGEAPREDRPRVESPREERPAPKGEARPRQNPSGERSREEGRSRGKRGGP